MVALRGCDYATGYVRRLGFLERGSEQIESGVVLDFFEDALVTRLNIGLASRYKTPLDKVHKCRIHSLHTDIATRLHGRFDLVQFALANQVCDGRCINHNLECGDTARFVLRWQELLRDNATE